MLIIKITPIPNSEAYFIIIFVLSVLVLLTLIGVIIYTTYYNGNYYKLNWSYALCWGGIISYFAAFIMQVIHIDKMKKEDSRKNVKYTSQRRV